MVRDSTMLTFLFRYFTSFQTAKRQHIILITFLPFCRHYKWSFVTLLFSPETYGQAGAEVVRSQIEDKKSCVDVYSSVVLDDMEANIEVQNLYIVVPNTDIIEIL